EPGVDNEPRARRTCRGASQRIPSGPKRIAPEGRMYVCNLLLIGQRRKKAFANEGASMYVHRRRGACHADADGGQVVFDALVWPAVLATRCSTIVPASPRARDAEGGVLRGGAEAVCRLADRARVAPCGGTEPRSRPATEPPAVRALGRQRSRKAGDSPHTRCGSHPMSRRPGVSPHASICVRTSTWKTGVLT